MKLFSKMETAIVVVGATCWSFRIMPQVLLSPCGHLGSLRLHQPAHTHC